LTSALATTAAIEASLLFLTELAKRTVVGSEPSENLLNSFGNPPRQALPSHLNQRLEDTSLDGRFQSTVRFGDGKNYGDHYMHEDWRSSRDSFSHRDPQFSSERVQHDFPLQSTPGKEGQYNNMGIDHRLSSRFDDSSEQILERSSSHSGLMRSALFDSNHGESNIRDGIASSCGDSEYSHNYRQVYSSPSGEPGPSRRLHHGDILRTSSGGSSFDRNFNDDKEKFHSYDSYDLNLRSIANVDKRSPNMLDKHYSPFQGSSAPDSSVYPSESFDLGVLRTSPSRVHSGSKHRKRKLYDEARPVKKHKSDHYSSSSRSKHSKMPSKVSVQNRLGPQPMEDLRTQLSKQIPAIEKSKSAELHSSFMSSVGFDVSLQPSPEKNVLPPNNPFFDHGVQENSIVTPLPMKNEVDLVPPLSHKLLGSSDTNTLETAAVQPSPSFYSSSSMRQCEESENKRLHLNFESQEPGTHKHEAEISIKKEIEEVDNQRKETVHPKDITKEVSSSVRTPSELKKKSPDLLSTLEQSRVKQSPVPIPTFPFLGKSNVKLPFSLPEEKFEEHLKKAEGTVESDSESENALVIDVSNVPQSPNVPLNSLSHSVVKSSAKKEDWVLGSRFCVETKSKCIEVAETILNFSLLGLLKNCTPNPLNILYSSMQVVFKSIECSELSVPTVQHAFRSFAISKADHPWDITCLFKEELACLLKTCENSVEKWKSSANVFHSILESLIGKPKSEISHQPHDSLSDVPDNFTSLMISDKPISFVGGSGTEELKGHSECIAEGKSLLVSSDLENDVGTDSSECNMSVCSVNNEEIIAVDKRNRDHSRSDSLSSGELTPTPPSSPIGYSFENASVFHSSQHVPCNEKVSSTLLKTSYQASTPAACSASESKTHNFNDKSSFVADPSVPKSVESHEGERALIPCDKSLDMKKELKVRGPKIGRHNDIRPASYRKFLDKRADYKKSHQMHKRLPSVSSRPRRDYSSRSKSSLRKHRRSLSPLTQERSSLKQVSHRRTRSPPTKAKKGDLMRRHTSKSPEHDLKYRKSIRSKSVDSDDDIELLQLKKEVILSIVQKPKVSEVEVEKSEAKPVSSKYYKEIGTKQMAVHVPVSCESKQYVATKISDIVSGTAVSLVADTSASCNKSHSLALNSAVTHLTHSSKPGTNPTEMTMQDSELNGKSYSGQKLDRDTQKKSLVKMASKKCEGTGSFGPKKPILPVSIHTSSKKVKSKPQKSGGTMESSAPKSPVQSESSNAPAGSLGSESESCSKEMSVMVGF